MNKKLYMMFAALLILVLAGCATPNTKTLVSGETGGTSAGVKLEDVEYAVAQAVQSLLKYDRIKLLPGGNRAVTVVPNTVIDTTARGIGVAALSEDITLRLQSELTNSGKILVYDPDAAQYASNAPEVQYVLASVLRSRNITQDNGLVEIEYSFNMKLIDKASGTLYWQKSIPVRKVTTRRRSLSN
ncbi:MAG: hypothetical protein IJS08_05075 [Victivallales bacterium]|nr:hypothetical protein [Victivallales bacterium]